MPNDFYEEHSWGHPGPYTVAYAEYPEGYIGPITVTHPNGQSKVIMVEAVHTPEFGPSDQEVEAKVIATLKELGTLPALVEWKKYIPWIAAAGLGITLLIVLSRPAHAKK